MMDANTFRQLALSFEGTEQAPHFNRIAFKITGRKIFATLLEEAAIANIHLSLSEQAVYTAFDDAAVYAIPNKWGLKGWTTFELNKVPVELVSSALFSAYSDVLQTKPKKSKR